MTQPFHHVFVNIFCSRGYSRPRDIPVWQYLDLVESLLLFDSQLDDNIVALMLCFISSRKFQLFILQYCTTGSVVNIVTRLHTGNSRNISLIPVRNKKFPFLQSVQTKSTIQPSIQWVIGQGW
jgi:hypothetical protein